MKKLNLQKKIIVTFVYNLLLNTLHGLEHFLRLHLARDDEAKVVWAVILAMIITYL